MKTTINRHDVHLFERLVTKLVKSTELPATASFASCTEGLQFIAYSKDAVLSMTVPATEIVHPFTLPWATIKELASKKNDTAELDVFTNTDSVNVSWSVGGVPQHRNVPSLGLTDKRLPPLPDNTDAHQNSIFDALVNAGKCVDAENTRYSLGAICLRGSKAQIVSTDGRQAFIQDGFAFPWDKDVLCPVSRIFASKELRDFSDTVRIGYENDWILFEIGPLKLWFKQIDGKFPQLDQFMKNIDGRTWLHVEHNDAAFVVNRLDNLPGAKDKEHPVYVELGQHVSVRGHDLVQKSATELRLSKSRHEGKPVMIPVNRYYHKNALDLGMNRIGIDPDERTPLVCYGDRKTVIIMPLEGDEPKVDASKITVLKSDTKAAVMKSDKVKCIAPVATVAARRVRPTAMPSLPTNEQMDVIAASEGLCQTLADTLSITRRLVRNLKQQRKQNRLMRATIASLKQLQNV